MIDEMNIIKWDTLTTGKNRQKQYVAITIGTFDGIHTGHQKLIASVLKADSGIMPLVVTFSENPALILKKPGYLGDIT
ncbi:MAG: hypothetical protein JW969_16655, partial [Spirochaetales bacterium]|nr:hypothetical protein [Spirochaetales bacterium]